MLRNSAGQPKVGRKSGVEFSLRWLIESAAASAHWPAASLAEWSRMAQSGMGQRRAAEQSGRQTRKVRADELRLANSAQLGPSGRLALFFKNGAQIEFGAAGQSSQIGILGQ